jgi:hypothetical protein
MESKLKYLIPPWTLAMTFKFLTPPDKEWQPLGKYITNIFMADITNQLCRPLLIEPRKDLKSF